MSPSTRTVLVADDSPLIRERLCGLFQASGFKVCAEAKNGFEAIEQAGNEQPDLIVLDLSMPVLNGLQAARSIRRKLPDTPIILFTLYAEAVTPQDAEAAGVNAVISKSDIEAIMAEAKVRLNT